MVCIDPPWLRYYEDRNIKKKIKKAAVSLHKFDNKNVCITFYIVTKTKTDEVLSSQKKTHAAEIAFFF